MYFRFLLYFSTLKILYTQSFILSSDIPFILSKNTNHISQLTSTNVRECMCIIFLFFLLTPVINMKNNNGAKFCISTQLSASVLLIYIEDKRGNRKRK